ncbi:unnamed protein product, partial [Larinioides sclopetarius]
DLISPSLKGKDIFYTLEHVTDVKTYLKVIEDDKIPLLENIMDRYPSEITKNINKLPRDNILSSAQQYDHESVRDFSVRLQGLVNKIFMEDTEESVDLGKFRTKRLLSKFMSDNDRNSDILVTNSPALGSNQNTGTPNSQSHSPISGCHQTSSVSLSQGQNITSQKHYPYDLRPRNIFGFVKYK